LGVVSIRVEGISITIVDGNIAIEQTRTESAAVAVPKVVQGLAAATNGAVQTNTVFTERAAPLATGVDNTGDSGARNSAPVVNAPHRPPGRNGPTGLPGNSGKGQEARSGQTKSAWSDEEVKKLAALWPTHSASATAKQLGRGLNAVRSKVQNLGLKKAAPPTVREAKPAPKPKPLSAAVTADLAPLPNGFSAVSLLDHHPGQCRWIISDAWPVLYCGAPVVDSSSWCGQHSSRVFNPERQRWVARESKEPHA
jgi:hypothetical protein